MKLGLITKRNKKIFESKINKKSYFLRSLPKKKYEGIKKVEEGKTDLLIDKILGLGEFERDYAFFYPQTISNSTPKDIILSPNVKSSLKNRISYIIQKDNKNKYENYKYEEEEEEEDDSEIFISRDNINKNKCWKPKKLGFSPIPVNNSKKYMNFKQNSFLSKIGNNIITQIPKYDKENSKKINVKFENK